MACEVDRVFRAVESVEVCNSFAHVIQSRWIMLLKLKTLGSKDILTSVNVIESKDLPFNLTFRRFIVFFQQKF